MQKRIVGIIGYFATGKSKSGGQEAKTCAIAEALDKVYGSENVIKVDTLGWKRHPFRLFIKLIKIGFGCKNVAFLPAQNSVAVFVPILVFARFFSGSKLHYVVVGGWLPELLKGKPILRRMARKLDGIYVETSSMQNNLTEMHFSNIYLFPNFKYIKPLNEIDLSYNIEMPLRLCFFSRVMRQKGVEDIVRAVREINTAEDKIVFSLDIFGPVQPGEEAWFQSIKQIFPPYIEYKGFVEPEDSVQVLKNYFALVFPTHYRTEGIPGTIIDAYSAGVPVITALWDNCSDIFEEGITGFGYELGNYDALVDCLNRISDNPIRLYSMKKNVLAYASNFAPNQIVPLLLRNFAE